MARRQPKIPQNVALLQRRYEDAQQQFDAAYQERMQQYTGEISAFEGRIANYEQQAQAYLNDVEEYSRYLNSFFIAPGTNNPETFVKYGNNFYWAADITPGFNLKAIENMPSLSGGEFQFVATNEQKHAYSYQSYEYVPSGYWGQEPYTAYETQRVPVQKLVYKPAPIGSGQSSYVFETVYEPRTVPVQRTRPTYIDTSKYEFVNRTATENIQIGYLKTQTPEGQFTTLRPEQFAVRSEPQMFAAPAPEAPGAVDIADIRGELEKEQVYLQRETGEISAAARRARMRKQVRPLLSEGEAA